MGHAQLPGRGALKGGYRLAENKLLRLKHRLDRVQQFLVERRYWRLRSSMGTGWTAGAASRTGAPEVTAASFTRSFYQPAAQGSVATR